MAEVPTKKSSFSETVENPEDQDLALPNLYLSDSIARMLYKSYPDEYNIDLYPAKGSFELDYQNLQNLKTRLKSQILEKDALLLNGSHSVVANLNRDLNNYSNIVFSLEKNLTDAYLKAHSSPEYSSATDPLGKQLLMHRVSNGLLNWRELAERKMDISNGVQYDIPKDFKLPEDALIFRDVNELKEIFKPYVKMKAEGFTYDKAKNLSMVDLRKRFQTLLKDNSKIEAYSEKAKGFIKTYEERTGKSHDLPDGMTMDDVLGWFIDPSKAHLIWKWQKTGKDGEIDAESQHDIRLLMASLLHMTAAHFAAVEFDAFKALEKIDTDRLNSFFDVFPQYRPSERNPDALLDFIQEQEDLLTLYSPVRKTQDGYEVVSDHNSPRLRENLANARAELDQLLANETEDPDKYLVKMARRAESMTLSEDASDTTLYGWEGKMRQSTKDKFRNYVTSHLASLAGQIQGDKSYADFWAENFIDDGRIRHRTGVEPLPRFRTALQSREQAMMEHLRKNPLSLISVEPDTSRDGGVTAAVSAKENPITTQTLERKLGKSAKEITKSIDDSYRSTPLSRAALRAQWPLTPTEEEHLKNKGK